MGDLDVERGGDRTLGVCGHETLRPEALCLPQRAEEAIGQARHKATDEPRPRCAAALGAGFGYIMRIPLIHPGAIVNRPPAALTALTPLETAVGKMP